MITREYYFKSSVDAESFADHLDACVTRSQENRVVIEAESQVHRWIEVGSDAMFWRTLDEHTSDQSDDRRHSFQISHKGG